MTFDPNWPHGHLSGGHKARIICTDAKGPTPIVALLETTTGEVARLYSSSGRHELDASINLVNAPAPKRKFVRWVNMYEHKSWCYSHITKETADHEAASQRIACVRVEFEEGEGL